MEDNKNIEAEESSEDRDNQILKTREEYGRYFGICGSYHHLKACLCKYCSACPEGQGMFCARGGVILRNERTEECLCETCELFKKFRLEGDCFCHNKKKKDTSEIETILDKKPAHPEICTNFQTSAGTIRICVLGEQDMHSK